jgi:hypothetical protein
VLPATPDHNTGKETLVLAVIFHIFSTFVDCATVTISSTNILDHSVADSHNINVSSVKFQNHSLIIFSTSVCICFARDGVTNNLAPVDPVSLRLSISDCTASCVLPATIVLAFGTLPPAVSSIQAQP